jgi:hypothetical protein
VSVFGSVRYVVSRTTSGAMKYGVPSTRPVPLSMPTLSLSQISTSPPAGSKKTLPKEMSR